MGKLCQLLEISRSGYYAWLRGGESARKTANQALLRELVRLHEKYPALGLDCPLPAKIDRKKVKKTE